MTSAAQTQPHTPVELRLRERIDVLTDQRDQAREERDTALALRDKARETRDRWRHDANYQRNRAEMWKNRARGSASPVYLGVPVRVESVGVVVDGRRFESMASARRWIRDQRRAGRAA